MNPTGIYFIYSHYIVLRFELPTVDEDFQSPATLFSYFANTFSGSSKSDFLFPITDYAEYYESPQQVIYSKQRDWWNLFHNLSHLFFFRE